FSIILAFSILASSILPLSSAQVSCNIPNTQSNDYYLRGVEAAEWISSFAVTPPEAGWGIPYHNSSAWGLDPFWYDNGTIMGGSSGIPAGEKQNRAFLIGGHDSGLAAQALLRSYLFTKDPSYLSRFNVYLDFFKRAQLPSPHVAVKAVSNVTLGNSTVLIDNSGFFAEQSNVLAGKDGIYGTKDDEVVLVSAFPSPEHGNPIARALVLYYDISGDKTVLPLITKYVQWLLRIQVKSGQYAGAFPVTPQSYIQRGWLPRMYETTESATVLLEAYRITKNSTYLRAAENATRLMLRFQYSSSNTNDTKIDGSLPYIWLGRRYNSDPLTNFAGFALSAWMLTSQYTGNATYLYGYGGTKDKPTTGAAKYADWLLSWQTTPSSLPWGDHAYSNDTNAIGGYFYAYNATGHRRDGFDKAQVVWSAAFVIGPLLQLSEITGESKYADSAKLAAEWLTRMRYDDLDAKQVQGLTIFKAYRGSWWGRYPQAYMPDSSEIQPLKDFVQKGFERPENITKSNASKTWFERTFGIDFNLELFRMASRGVKYMKMMWSWWPDLGFEPRYGGDVARGYFDMANYRKAKEMSNIAIEEQNLVKTALSQTSRFSNEFKDAIPLLKDADIFYKQGNEDFLNGRWELSIERMIAARNITAIGFKAMKDVAKSSLDQTSTEAGLLSDYRWFSTQARGSFANALTNLEDARKALNQGNVANALEMSLSAAKLIANSLQIDTQERLDLLQRTRSELSDAQSQLSTTRNQLQQTNSNLQSTRDALSSTNKDLDVTKNTLESTRKELETTKSSLDQTKNDLRVAQERIGSLTQNLNTTRTILEISDREISSLAQLLQITQIGALGAFVILLAVVVSIRRRTKSTEGG
ncbi:MAG: hypothetical protein HYU02_01515, partial [Thaumarchaeota archaeon]|nr:hypothetical protein [Nitrososphaerota archaeon]